MVPQDNSCVSNDKHELGFLLMNPDTIIPSGECRSGFFIRYRSVRGVQVKVTPAFLPVKKYGAETFL